MRTSTDPKFNISLSNIQYNNQRNYSAVLSQKTAASSNNMYNTVNTRQHLNN